MRIVIEVVYDLNEKDDLIEDDDSDTVVPVVKKTRKVSFEYLDCDITALHRVTSSQTSTS